MSYVRENLETVLRRRSVSRSSLAAAIGIGERDLRRRLAGTVRFTLDEVEDVARELRVDPGALAFWEPQRFRLLLTERR